MFRDRRHAGELLAAHFSATRSDLKTVMVFALPRGGIAVAAPVAELFKTTLYPLGVRKIGAPDHEEFAIGALGEENEIIMNNDVITSYGFEWDQIEPIVDRERKELARRIEMYRGGRALPNVRGKTAVIVDDGLATGTTMLVCVNVLKKLKASRVIVAVPVASKGAVDRLRNVADEIVALSIPPSFMAVGQFYEFFPQVTDREVLGILEENRNFAAEQKR